VRRSPGYGSRLTAVGIDAEQRHLPFFLYRATFLDATNDTGTYAASVIQDRIDEFRQLIGYVTVLSLAVVWTTVMLATAARIAYRRRRQRVAQRLGHSIRRETSRASS
jgi:hypothetical protein